MIIFHNVTIRHSIVIIIVIVFKKKLLACSQYDISLLSILFLFNVVNVIYKPSICFVIIVVCVDDCEVVIDDDDDDDDSVLVLLLQ